MFYTKYRKYVDEMLGHIIGILTKLVALEKAQNEEIRKLEARVELLELDNPHL